MTQRKRPDFFGARGLVDADGAGLRDAAVRGGVGMVMFRAGNQALSLLFSVVLVRILSPDDYGLVAIVLAVVGIAALFKDMGLSAATIQRAQISPQMVSSLFWINTGLGAAVSLICALAAPLLARFYGRPELASIGGVLCLTFFLSGASVQHNALMYRKMQFSQNALIALVATVVAGSIAVIMARNGFGPWALVAQNLIANIVSLVMVFRATRFFPGPFVWNDEVRQMMGFGGQFFLFRVLGYLAQNLQVMILGKELGAASAALYMRAYLMNKQILSYANDTAGQIANSALPRLREDQERYVRFYQRTLNVMFLATMPAAIFLGCFSQDLILFLFGPRWQASADLLRILAVGMLVQPLLYSTGWIYFSQGDVSGMVRWGMFGWTTMIAACIVGLHWGEAGVAWSWSLGLTVLVVPCALAAFRGRGITLGSCTAVMWPPLLAAVLSLIPALPAHQWLVSQTVFLRLPALAALFGLSYAALLWWVFGQKPLMMEILDSLVRKKAGIGKKSAHPVSHS